MAVTNKGLTGHLTPLGDGRNWDPEPNQRTYYRSLGSADRGWLVRRDGIDSIKLDRPMQDITRPFKAAEWVAEVQSHPLAPISKARIAFALDHELCQQIGLIRGSRKGWLDLTDEKKVEFMENGPSAGPDCRLKMYALVMEGLKDLWSDPAIYTLVERAVSQRPVQQADSATVFSNPSQEPVTSFINRELIPLLGQIRSLVNAMGKALNAGNVSVGAGVPTTVLEGVGVYVRTDAVSASTVLYVSFGGVWAAVTVP